MANAARITTHRSHQGNDGHYRQGVVMSDTLLALTLDALLGVLSALFI